MNWDRIEANWKQFTGKLKEQWGKLTGSDVDAIAGKKTALLGRLQERYGLAKEEAEKQVDSWLAALKDKKEDLIDTARKVRADAQRLQSDVHEGAKEIKADMKQGLRY